MALRAPLNRLAAHALARLDAAGGELKARAAEVAAAVERDDSGEEVARGGGVGGRTRPYEATMDVVALLPLALLLD